MHTISNSLADALFEPHVPAKARGVAENIPGNASTYIFSDEITYLAHYRRALLAVTRKADPTYPNPHPTLPQACL